MTVLDYILDGVEAELTLERELGVRSIECDRAVVTVRESAPESSPSASCEDRVPRPQEPVAGLSAQVADRGLTDTDIYDFVFLHDRALSANGVAMMAKIIPAMGKAPEAAPIVFTGELPKARAYVVLGGNALKKWFPGTAGAPGQWVSTTGAPNVLVTYSPEYVLRFGTVTPAVQKLKRDMWTSLKSVLQRVR